MKALIATAAAVLVAAFSSIAGASPPPTTVMCTQGGLTVIRSIPVKGEVDATWVDANNFVLVTVHYGSERVLDQDFSGRKLTLTDTPISAARVEVFVAPQGTWDWVDASAPCTAP